MRKFSSILLLAAALPCASQSTSSRAPLNLVMPNGTGRVVVPARDDLQWQSVSLYDHGTRPVLLMQSKSTRLAISFMLFPNTTGSSLPQICRDDVLNAAVRSLSPQLGLADIKQVKKEDHPALKGRPLATGSFLVASLAGAKVDQRNVFGVEASSSTCAKIHVSLTPYKPADEPTLQAQLDTFVFDSDYVPVAQDYMRLGSIFYNNIKSYEAAAYYYQSALNTLPADAPLSARRVITDQLAMSYGISGNLKQSRAVNEAAMKTDPDYPL